jgi:hypothetical protein
VGTIGKGIFGSVLMLRGDMDSSIYFLWKGVKSQENHGRGEEEIEHPSTRKRSIIGVQPLGNTGELENVFTLF